MTPLPNGPGPGSAAQAKEVENGLSSGTFDNHLMPNSFTIELDQAQRAKLVSLLNGGNYRLVSIEHTVAAADTTDCRIALYKSGKCLVQGKGAEDFVRFVLEPEILGAARLGYEDVLDPDAIQPHIGVDESGKGDFFGPLVAAGAYVDPSLAPAMRTMGVRDSKKISSDRVALDMARDLRKLLGNRFAIVPIGPSAYNRLYAQMRNVNRMLSWAHARVIENMLERVPECPRAVSDQFGSKEQVQRALMKRGRKIKLIQKHRAESDLAVAAASVLARAAFLSALHGLGEQFGVTLPKGASPAVREAGVALVKARGEKVLLDVAKCHFRTTDAVLGELGKERGALGPLGAAVSKSALPPP